MPSATNSGAACARSGEDQEQQRGTPHPRAARLRLGSRRCVQRRTPRAGDSACGDAHQRRTPRAGRTPGRAAMRTSAARLAPATPRTAATPCTRTPRASVPTLPGPSTVRTRTATRSERQAQRGSHCARSPRGQPQPDDTRRPSTSERFAVRKLATPRIRALPSLGGFVSAQCRHPPQPPNAADARQHAPRRHARVSARPGAPSAAPARAARGGRARPRAGTPGRPATRRRCARRRPRRTSSGSRHGGADRRVRPGLAPGPRTAAGRSSRSRHGRVAPVERRAGRGRAPRSRR